MLLKVTQKNFNSLYKIKAMLYQLGLNYNSFDHIY